ERRDPKDGHRVVWLAEPGKERDFIIVLVPGGPGRNQSEKDYSHLGFALDSRAAVDAVAAKADAVGRLMWPPRDEPYPVGHYRGGGGAHPVGYVGGGGRPGGPAGGVQLGQTPRPGGGARRPGEGPPRPGGGGFSPPPWGRRTRRGCFAWPLGGRVLDPPLQGVC